MDDSDKYTDGKSRTITAVPLLDLQAQYRPLRTAIEAAIRAVCESQQFVLGPEVSKLEQEIARYSQTRHAVGVSSGTDALLIALMALGVGAGHEVITTTYGFFASGGVIARLGARPVFCDIDAETYNIDPKAVIAFLQNECRREGDRVVNVRTGGVVKAIMPVHLFGQMANMASFVEVSEHYGLPLVEDAAQAIGAETPDERRAGSIGEIGCFSFFPSKNLGAFGDAGMCVTQSDELAERIRALRVHGASSNGHLALVGGNFRLDALQAAVLNVKLAFLDAWTSARQENALSYKRYFEELRLPIKTPAVQQNGRHVYNQYVIETADRDRLHAFLREKSIGTGVYYSVPLHLQECYRHLGYREGDCPVAERAARRTLALPVYPEMSRQQQEHVVDSIARFFNGR